MRSPSGSSFAGKHKEGVIIKLRANARTFDCEGYAHKVDRCYASTLLITFRSSTPVSL